MVQVTSPVTGILCSSLRGVNKCDCDKLDFAAAKSLNKEGLSCFVQDHTTIAALNDRLAHWAGEDEHGYCSQWHISTIVLFAVGSCSYLFSLSSLFTAPCRPIVLRWRTTRLNVGLWSQRRSWTVNNLPLASPPMWLNQATVWMQRWKNCPGKGSEVPAAAGCVCFMFLYLMLNFNFLTDSPLHISSHPISLIDTVTGSSIHNLVMIHHCPLSVPPVGRDSVTPKSCRWSLTVGRSSTRRLHSREFSSSRQTLYRQKAESVMDWTV